MKSFSILLLCGVLFIVMLIYNIQYLKNSDYSIIDIGKFEEIEIEEEKEDLRFVKNIESSSTLLLNGENVFFVETQNSTQHILNDRQACSIESAALMNPNALIIVTFVTPKHFVDLNETRAIEILRQYSNIIFRFVNLKSFSKNTPLENWIKSGKLSNSKFVVSHTSDVLRYLLLYKYSGLYLDTDVIVTYPYGRINIENYACAESHKFLNGAILKLTGESGRQIAESFMQDLIANFDGNVWGKNGPELLTRVIKKMCNISYFNSTQKCKNFTILETEKCYGIGWEEWVKFFEPHKLDSVRRHTKNSYYVHLWNKFSKTRKLEKNSTAGLNEILRKFCPRVYKSLDNFF
ncbi:hypothetical protein PVAND_004607 [Polypedilum vanderplanki]|uniref:Alpha 1,4-glycosyltransferase domain-containing protein n=1 Tax=Polypedilum vanderplanki TaxID=319348 RepID=A0A9J6BYM0_POLVA|nr:hypothetical protein PVAND_004607 [Polypedilum vanderplanki]